VSAHVLRRPIGEVRIGELYSIDGLRMAPKGQPDAYSDQRVLGSAPRSTSCSEVGCLDAPVFWP